MAGALSEPAAPAAAQHVIARVSVRVSIAPLMAGPRPSSGQTSQLLRGHQADVIEDDGQWRRLLGADGYDGWCHRGYLTQETAPPVGPLASAWSAERRMSVGCTVRTSDGGVIVLPLGAMLDADEEVVDGLAMNARARARYFASDTALLTQRCVELFRGAPYQWGGVTPWGVDCSGIVQTMYALHGTQLPRDAWQQGERGREIAGDASELHAGDLLFFSDREDWRITHVAMSLGGARLVHSSLANGGFGINALDASDVVSEGLRRNFRFARRIL